MGNNIIEKLYLFDELLAHAIIGAKISVNDGIMCDSNGNEMSWEDYDGVSFKKPIPGTNIDGYLIFGDGTLEFHEINEEAFNWGDYPIEIIEKVNDYIKTNVIVDL